MRVLTLYAGICLFVALLAGPSIAGTDAAGAAIFRARCGKCHGEDGHGKSQAEIKMKVLDLRSKSVQSLSDSELYETIAYGAKHREYPHAFLYTGLTKPQIESIVAFIRTLK